MTDGPLDAREVRQSALGLVGAMTAAEDQVRSMSDDELGELLLRGHWTTIEIHEAGLRLQRRAANSHPRGDE